MKGGVKLREAKVTTLRRVLLARSCAMGVLFIGIHGEYSERETFITKLGEGQKNSKESRKATRSEGDDLEESATRALIRHVGRGRGGRGEGRR